MKRTLKWCLCLMLIFSVCLAGINVSAQSFKSFSRNQQADSTNANVLARECYTAVKLIRASDYGLEEEFSEMSDIFCDENGFVYVLCSGNSQIIVLNSDLTLNRCISVKDDKGEVIKFEKAQGIYVKGEKIYLCDTQNARILITDLNGVLSSVMELPDSEIIPDDFVYQPTRLTIDSDGYTYILSMGCYYGALVYLPDGTFGGFYGANNVQATALDTLSYIWDLLTGNDEKKSASQKTLPYAFVDFCFDNGGYMLTCTGATSGSNAGQINKMSPGGSNILYKSNADGSFSKSSGVNFLESSVIKRNNAVRMQNIVSIDVDSENYIYALDNTYGLIYVYDSQCNLINAFGGGVGAGERLGNFSSATAMAISGNKLLVTDSEAEAITVFEETSYGALLKKAQAMYLAGDYEEAEEYWEKVLSLDSNNQLAYKGLAIASYKKGDINKTLYYAKAGLDYNMYDLAFQARLKQTIAANFMWLFPLLLILIVGIIVGLIYKSKKQIVLIKNPKLVNLTSTVIHPFRTFNDIKQKNMGSVTAACVISVLFYLTTTLRTVGSSFLFTDISAGNYNTLFTVAQTLGLVALWSVSNWLICSLFSGKGTFKEVFICTNYCLIPIIFYNVLRTLLSYVMPLSGKGFLDGLYVVILIYTAYLLCVAFTTIHDYSLGKLIGTAVVTVLGMLLVIFVIFMIVILIQQLWDFIYSIFVEAIYR